MSDIDEPGALTAEGLFRLVTDEVFADGVLEDREKQLMQTLARFLRLQPERAKEIARESKAAYKAGELEHSERLSPSRLYQRILVAVLADGEVDEFEAQLLEGMKKILGIEEELHEGMIAAVQVSRRVEVEGPPPTPASPPSSEPEGGPEPGPPAPPAPPGPARPSAPDPSGDSAPDTLEDLPDQAAAAAQTGDPRLLLRLRDRLDEVDRPPEAGAPALARALANMAILSMPRRDRETVDEAMGRLRKLRPFAAHEKVQEEALVAWGCYLEWLADCVQRGLGDAKLTAQVQAAVDQILDLLTARTPSREAIENFCSSLGAAGFVHLVALADHERILALVGALREVCEAYPGDEAVQFTVAKLMVNTGIMVSDSWPSRGQSAGFFGSLKKMVGGGERTPRDDCLDAMQATMEEILRQAPGSADVRDAQGRFERQTGRKLAAPAGGPPVPDAPRPSGRTPVPEGWRDEDPGWPRGKRGRYPTPMAAVDALEDAYEAKDMNAYLDALMALYILDTEMGRRQATYGRMARAVGRHLTERPALASMGMLGTKLRHLVEDLGDSGNPELEREARALQDVYQGALRR